MGWTHPGARVYLPIRNRLLAREMGAARPPMAYRVRVEYLRTCDAARKILARSVTGCRIGASVL